MFQRSWTRATLTVALAASMLAGSGCRRAKPVESRTVTPELKFEGVRFRVYRGSELRASGKAERAALRRDSTEVTAKNLEATLPRSTPPVRITAPSGQGVMSSRIFSASGGVTATRGGDVARTERARYLSGPDGGRVVGEDPVVVEGPAYRLEGTGFTLAPAETELAIGGGIRLVAGGGARR